MHVMLKINWNDQNLEFCESRKGPLAYCRMLFWKKNTNISENFLSCRYTPWCLVMIGENKVVYWKLNYLKINSPAENTFKKYEILSSGWSLEAFHWIKVDITEPLEYDIVKKYMKQFQSST